MESRSVTFNEFNCNCTICVGEVSPLCITDLDFWFVGKCSWGLVAGSICLLSVQYVWIW